MTKIFARESVALNEVVTVADTNGDAVDITGWTFSAAVMRRAGATDINLGTVAPGSQGFTVIDGPAGLLRLRINQATLAGISDTTGNFTLFGDLLGTPPAGEAMFVAPLSVNVTTAGEEFEGRSYRVVLEAVAASVLAAITQLVEVAEAAADRSELAMDASVAFSNYHATRAAGAAATPTGQIFTSDEEGRLAWYRRTAIAPNYQFIGYVVSREDFGAINLNFFTGTDQQRFQAAFDAARDEFRFVLGANAWGTPGGAIFVPPGDYVLSDELLIEPKSSVGATIANLTLYAVPGTVTITNATGKYTVACDVALNRLHISGITSIGGKGLFLNRFTGINVLGQKVIEDCVAEEYTECGIGSNAADDPYWRVNRCFLTGDAASINRGLSLGGLIDEAKITNNDFKDNTYHFVFTAICSSFLFDNNSLLSYASGNVLADVVIGADIRVNGLGEGTYGLSSGHWGKISRNRFGPEGITATSPRILFANLDTGTGTGRENHPIDETWTTSTAGENWIYGLIIEDNLIGSDDTNNAPIIRSYIDKAAGIRWRNNTMVGTRHTYLVEFMGARTQDAFSDWDVELGISDGQVSNLFRFGVSNYSIGPIKDTSGSYMGADLVTMEALPVGDEQTIKWVSGPADWLALAPSNKATVAGVGPNGTDLTKITVGALGPDVMAYVGLPDVSALDDQMCQLILHAAQGASNPLTRFRIMVWNFTHNLAAMEIRNVELGSKIKRLKFAFRLPATATPTSWQVRLIPSEYETAAVGKEMLLGTMHVHTGQAAMAAPRAAAVTNPTDLATALTAVTALLDAARAENRISR